MGLGTRFLFRNELGDGITLWLQIELLFISRIPKEASQETKPWLQFYIESACDRIEIRAGGGAICSELRLVSFPTARGGIYSDTDDFPLSSEIGGIRTGGAEVFSSGFRSW